MYQSIANEKGQFYKATCLDKPINDQYKTKWPENYHIEKSTTPGFYLSLSLTVGSTF